MSTMHIRFLAFCTVSARDAADRLPWEQDGTCLRPTGAHAGFRRRRVRGPFSARPMKV